MCYCDILDVFFFLFSIPFPSSFSFFLFFIDFLSFLLLFIIDRPKEKTKLFEVFRNQKKKKKKRKKKEEEDGGGFTIEM